MDLTCTRYVIRSHRIQDRAYSGRVHGLVGLSLAFARGCSHIRGWNLGACLKREAERQPPTKHILELEYKLSLRYLVRVQTIHLSNCITLGTEVT